MLRSLHKDEENWRKRLKDAQAKTKEISSEKKYLRDSLDVVLLCHKGLENELSNLNDDVVSAVDVYFERAKEQVFSLYPTLNMSPLYPFKVVKGGEMVDEGAMTSPKPEHFPVQEEGTTQEGGEPEIIVKA